MYALYIIYTYSTARLLFNQIRDRLMVMIAIAGVKWFNVTIGVNATSRIDLSVASLSGIKSVPLAILNANTELECLCN
jgi:hypothetical protein